MFLNQNNVVRFLDLDIAWILIISMITLSMCIFIVIMVKECSNAKNLKKTKGDHVKNQNASLVKENKDNCST